MDHEDGGGEALPWKCPCLRHKQGSKPHLTGFWKSPIIGKLSFGAKLKISYFQPIGIIYFVQADLKNPFFQPERLPRPGTKEPGAAPLKIPAKLWGYEQIERLERARGSPLTRKI